MVRQSMRRGLAVLVSGGLLTVPAWGGSAAAEPPASQEQPPATTADPTVGTVSTFTAVVGGSDATVDISPDPDDYNEPTDSTSTAFDPPDGRYDWTGYYLDSAGRKVYYAASNSGTWWDAQCPGGDGSDRYHHLKEYPRAKLHPRMKGDYGILYCGMVADEGSEHAFGFRKIRAKHKSQFAKYAAWQGSDWANFMNWTVWHTVSQPENVTNQSPTRFCYEKRFVWKNPNGTLVTRTVAVILGETAQRIMSAWPRTNGNFTCKGTQVL